MSSMDRNEKQMNDSVLTALENEDERGEKSNCRETVEGSKNYRRSVSTWLQDYIGVGGNPPTHQ